MGRLLRITSVVSLLIVVFACKCVAAEPDAKKIIWYSREQLKEVGKVLLNADIEVRRVQSNAAGDALYLYAYASRTTRVAIVPLDPNKEVRFLEFQGYCIIDDDFTPFVLADDKPYPGQGGYPFVDRGDTAPVPDATGRFVAYQKSSEGNTQTRSAYVARTTSPEEPIVFSKLRHISDIYTDGDRLFIFGDSETDGATSVTLEIFRSDGPLFSLEEEMTIKSPARRHDGLLWVDSFDPTVGAVFLSDMFDFPFTFRNRHVIYDIWKKRFIWKGQYRERRAFFLKGDILARFLTEKG